MSKFKQIIGRGTRLHDDCGKLWFNILDYAGAATRMFVDPKFDGDPVLVTEDQADDEGNTTVATDTVFKVAEEPGVYELAGIIESPDNEAPRKFYFDGGQVEIVAHDIGRSRRAAERG